MTFVEAALFIPFLASAILVLWLLAYVVRNMTQHRMNEVEGMDNMEVHRWQGWTPLMAWPPVTCWRGCADLHREDWWRAYLDRTCWQGCEGLHREDWWRAYVDQPDEHRERVVDSGPRQSSNTAADSLNVNRPLTY